MGSGIADLVRGVGTNLDSSGGRKPVDVIAFVEAPWGLNMRLFPVQRVILKAHYGLELDDTATFKISDWRREVFRDFTEASYLRYLYEEGRSNIKEVTVGKERRELVLPIGRRSGKTFLAAIIAGYETYKLILKGNPQNYYGLPSSNNLQIVSVATSKDQAGLLYQEVSGHFRNCGFFGPYTANNTQSYARFQTPSDIERYGRYADDPTARATLRVSFASCIAKGLRGAGNIVVILDEVAHFTDEGHSSAEKVYNAVTPSTSTFSPKDPNDNRIPIGPVEGRIISISSPLGRQGQFYTLFQIGMAGGVAAENILCIQAPTWEVNPTIPASEFEKHYSKDPTNFFTEYGASFTDRTKGWLETPQDLFDCIDPNLRPAVMGTPRRSYYVGIDIALKKDGSAIAIGHLDQDDRIVLDHLDQIKAGVGDFVDRERLEFEEVADWVLRLSRRFSLSAGIFDHWAGIPFEQALNRRGLRQLKTEHMTRPKISEIFKNLKDMMYDGRLLLYDWPIKEGEEHCAYIQELLELQAEMHSKYIVEVHAPKIAGKHDDMSDALSRMVWVASQHMSNRGYIAKGRGTGRITGVQGQSGVAATRSHRRSRINARRMGTSPDRQRSSINRGHIRGRF